MDVQSTLKEYIVTVFMHERNQSVLDSDTPLIEDGIIDSMGLMQLVHFIEDTFAIEIVEEDLDIDNFKTVNTLTAFINNKTTAK